MWWRRWTKMEAPSSLKFRPRWRNGWKLQALWIPSSKVVSLSPPLIPRCASKREIEEKKFFLALVGYGNEREGEQFSFFDNIFLKEWIMISNTKYLVYGFSKKSNSNFPPKAFNWLHQLPSWIVTRCHFNKVICDFHHLVMSSDVTSRCDLRVPLVSKYECVRKHFRARFR